MASGNKYHRVIIGLCKNILTVDVYAVLEAFEVTCPARQHALKKLLCSGIRGKGDTLQDLNEARDAITSAIHLEEARTQTDEDTSSQSERLEKLDEILIEANTPSMGTAWKERQEAKSSCAQADMADRKRGFQPAHRVISEEELKYIQNVPLHVVFPSPISKQPIKAVAGDDCHQCVLYDSPDCSTKLCMASATGRQEVIFKNQGDSIV